MQRPLNHSRPITYWDDEKYKESNSRQIRHIQRLLAAKKKRKEREKRRRERWIANNSLKS